MMADDTTFAVFGLGVIPLTRLLRKKKQKRSSWFKNRLLNHEQFSHMSLLQELQEKNPEDFRNYLRMTVLCFNQFLALVPLYQKTVYMYAGFNNS